MRADFYEAAITSSKNPDAALKWIEFSCEPRGAKFVVEGLGAFSPVCNNGVEMGALLILYPQSFLVLTSLKTEAAVIVPLLGAVVATATIINGLSVSRLYAVTFDYNRVAYDGS